MLIKPSPWTRQPQTLVRVAGKYADAAMAWLGHTPQKDITGRYQDLFDRQGTLQSAALGEGVGVYSGTYASNNRLTGASANPSTENWPGVTVVANVTARDITSNTFPSLIAWVPVGEFYGGFMLSMERDTSARYNILWRVGDSGNYLTPTTYNSAVAASQYAPGDQLTIVAGWDKATIWLVVRKSGELLFNSNAHSFGWRNSSSLFSLLGYERPAASYRTTPHAVNSVVVIPRDLRSEAYSLAVNPWQMFEPRRIVVPAEVASSGVTGTSATTNANDTSSASGTTTVVGTAAATNANDTATASGVVGSPVIGTSATTNANDTPSASGTTTVTGTSATTNANDSPAASGWAGAVTGMAAVTNADDTAQASGTVEGGATDTHDGFWHKEWLKRHKKKAPTIAEIVEAVRENPVEAVAQAKAIPEVVAEYPAVTIEAVRQNAALQRFIARQILEIMQEEDDLEALLLL